MTADYYLHGYGLLKEMTPKLNNIKVSIMINLTIMFVAGMVIGHGSPVKDDVGVDAGQFMVDERGKLVVYKSDALASDANFITMREQLTTFLLTKGNEITRTTAARLESTGSVPMEKHAGIGNYVAGEIHYTLVLENNAGEINYWFTDLRYQPYRNDRFGKRARATATPIPLEKKFSKMNEQVWKKQKNYAYDAIEALADDVLGQLETAGKTKVVTTAMD